MHSSVLSAVRALSVSTLAMIAFGFSVASAHARQATDCVTGANHVTAANNVSQMFTAFGLATADPSDPANAGCTLCGVPVTATATGMSAAQLSLLGNNAPYLAENGVSGTYTITSAVAEAPLGAVLAKTCLAANVTVNASGMTNAQLDQLVANIARIDTITNLAAGKTLTLTAAAAGGKFISGAGTVAISSDALGTSADLTTITTAGLTFPSSAPFFSVATGGLVSIYPERVSGYTIQGAGTVSLVGTVDFDVTVKDITATVSLDADGVTGTSIALGKTFTLTAAQANGQTIAGTGTTSVFGNIAANANFTLIASLLNIPGSVDAGATLTLTAAQGDGRTLTGAGNIALTTAALTANTNFRGLTTAGFAFSGSIASGSTLSINAVQSTITVSGAGTVDILGTAGVDTVLATNITAIRTISTLAGADTLTGGATADTLNGGADNDTIDGGAGIDTAVYAGSCAGAISGSSPLAITTTEDGTDSVTGAERLVFSDATISVIGRGGSEYTTLDQVLALSDGSKLFGTFTVTSASFTDAASLDALIARILGGSTVSVNVLGMNSTQLTAVAASAASFQPIAYPPVQVVSGTTITGYFSTIQAAINFATAGDVVNVAAGSYAENVTIAKAVDVRGPNYAVSPNGGVRAAEAILVPASTNTASGAVVTITSSGVSFRGFTVDGDNTALAASGVGLGGALGTSIDAARCVFLQGNGLNGVTLSKNIAKNAVNGLRIEQTTNYFATTAGALRSTNILLDDNLVQDMTGTGIRLGNSMFAKVTNNTVTNADNGIAFSSFRISDAGSAADRVIQGNTISARYAGIWVNLFHASPYALVNNTITVAAAATSMAPTPQSRTAWYGIMYSTVSAPQNFTNQVSLPLVATPERWTATGNIIDGAALESTSTGHGYWLYYVDNNRDTAGVDHFGQISGGSVSNVAYGVMLKNKDADPATNFGNSAVGAHAAVSGVAFSLNAGGTGFRLIDDAAWVTGNPAPLVNKRNVQLAVGAGNSITGGATGVSITRPTTFAQPDYNPIVGGSLSDLALSGQSGNYITLASPSAIDATGATFGGATGATATLAANYDIEDRISHKLDDSSLGLVRVKASNVFVSSIGNIGRGVTAATAGDTVNVEAGSYTENVTLDKRVTLLGAGSGADGTVLSSSTTATPVISVTGSGLDAANQLVIKDVRVFGAANASGSDGIAIYGDTPTAFVKVDGVHVTGHGQGVHYRSGTISNVTVANSTFNANNFGVRVATAVASMDGMTIDGCTMTEQTSSAISTNPSGSQTVVNTNFTVSNSTFANNSRAGVANQHDLSFFGFRGNATLSNVTVTSGNGTAQNSNSYGIVFTNGSGRAALGTVSLSNVTVQGHVGKGALTFQLYNETSGVSLSDVSLQNCVAPWGHLILDSTDTDAFAVGNTGLKTLNMWNSCGANATAAVFHSSTSGTVLDRTVLADAFQIADQVADAVDVTGLGYVNFRAGHVYVTPASFDARFNTAQGALQRAIAAASAGDVIHVKNGTETYLTAEITKSVTFDGAFTVTATSIPTGGTATAVLSSFTSRLASGSTLAVNFAGMNANQIAAANANFAFITSATGNPVTVTRAGSTVGYAPTIQSGIDYAAAGDTLNVAAGTYAEALTVSKSLTFRGPNAGKAGTDATRGAEAVIMAPAGMVASYADTAYIVTVPAGVSGVVFDGLLVNGDNPATTSPFTANGANPDADEGFSIEGDGAIVRNCVIKNVFQFGVAMGATGGTDARFGEVTDNLIENIPYWAAILVYNDYYAAIDGNTVVNAWRGVQTNNHYKAVPAGKTASISDNAITTGIQDIAGDATYADYDGILHNLQYGVSAWTIANNTITNTSAANTNGDCDGIEVWSIQTGATVTMSGNAIAGFPNGYTLWNCPATAGLTVSGGSVTGAINGVVTTNHDNYGDAASSSYTISGVAISASAAGVLVNDSASNTNGASIALALSGGSVTGGTTGLAVSGADATVTVATTAFSGQTGNYIALAGNANAIDATTATFGGATGATATRSANFAIASKVTDKGDNATLGRVAVKAGNVFVNSAATVALGVGAASANDTVNIEAGAYTDGAVTVNAAGLTIDSDAGVSGFSFTLGTANSLVLAGAGDVNVLGNAAANSVTASAGANSINGAAGVDTAVFASAAPSSLVAGSTISVGADTVTNVEKLVFSDATIALVGTGGSEYATLNAALAATTTEKLFGTLAINSLTFATAAELNAITARFVSGSTVSVDVLGMNATQLAAVAGNATASGVVVYPPVQVVSGTSITGYFTTIQAAINSASTAAGSTVNVAAGTYAENLVIEKSVALRGPNAAKSGTDATRVAEAAIVPAASAVWSEMIQVKASGVSIEGFTLDADNTALAASTTVTVSGATADASEAITAYYAGVNNLVVRNNVVQNFDYFGITIYPYYASGAIPAAQPNSGHVIADNLFRNFGTYAGESAFWGGAVLLYNNAYAQVTGNTMSNVRIGVQTGNFHLASPDAGFAHAISGNTITARRRGVFNNLFYSAATGFPVASNTITGVMNASETVFDGILVSSYSVPVAHTGNIVSAGDVTNPSDGIEVWNSAASAPGVTIAGGSVAGFTRGLFLNNYEGYNTDSSTGAIATASGMSISGCTTGIEVRDSALSTLHGPVSLAFGAGMTVSGGTTGLLVTNAAASVSSVGDAAFSGQSGNYIALAGNANAIDATGATFGGATGATATLAANYDIEDKISHKLDDSSLGLVRVKASNVFVASGGNIGRGVTAASTGDTVNVEAGSYTENVLVDKRITLDGAGSGTDGTIVTAATAATSVVTVTGSGSADGRLTVKDMRVAGSTASGIMVGNSAPVEKLTFDNIHANGMTDGISIGGTAATTDVVVSNSNLSSNLNNGLRVASATPSLNGLAVSNCTIASNQWQGFSYNASGSNNVGTNFSFTDCAFTNNCASNANSNGNHDLSFFGFKGNASLTNVTVTSNHTANGHGIVFTAQGLGFQPAGTIALNNVTVTGQVAKGALTFQFYSDISNVSMTDVSLQGCIAPWGDLIVESTDSDAFAVGNTALKSIVVWANGGADATGASFYSVAGSLLDRSVLADNYTISNQVGDVVDAAGLGLVRFAAGKIYVSAASAAGAFGRAIGASVDGDTIYVQDGAATVLTTAITKAITFSGNFNFTAANIPTGADATAVLTSFMDRKGSSTVTANVIGMNANQLAAVAANAAGFNALTYPPVQVVSGGVISGYFTTIQAAINFATAGDVVNVAAGTYAENVTIAKAVDVRGPNYAVSPNGGVRAAEAILVPASTNTASGAVVTITSSGVSFRGFTVDGDNTALAASGVGLGGALGTSIDAARCVFLQGNGLNGVTLSKNIAKNAVNGLRIEQTTNYFATTAGALRSTNILLDDNLVQDMTGTGIRLGNSMFAKVTNNTVTNADNGIAFSSFRISDAGSAADRVIQGNTISARYAGIWVNLFHASPYALVNNTITVAAAATSMAPTPQSRTAWYGIMYSTVSAPQNFTNQVSLPLVATPERWTATGNIIDGAALESTSTGHGYWLYYVDNNRDTAGVDHFGQISGGSVSNVAYGVMLKNKDADPATNFGNSAVGAHAAVSGVAFSLNAGGTGFRLIDDAAWVTGNPAPLVNKRNVQLAVGAGNSITGGATGVSITRPTTFAQPDYNPIVGGSLSDLALSGQSGDYILLASPSAIDATGATFGGATGATATRSANFAIASKVTDKGDNAALGRVTVKANNLFVNSSNSVATALAFVAAGETVNIEAGAYTDGAVTVNAAGLTIDSDAGVSGFSFTLGTANSLVLAGAGDVNVLGNAAANSVTASAGANSINGAAGVDTATMGIAMPSSLAVSGGSIAVGADTVSGIERLVFTDGTIAVIGVTGSEYTSLNQVLALAGGERLFGTLAINSSTFATAAELNAITARFVSGSTVSVDVLGMNATQLAAVAGNATASGVVVYPPVQVVSGTTITGYFSTIQAAINSASTAAGSTVNVAAGTYAENLVIEKSVALRGPNAAKSGTDATRVAEAAIVPAASAVWSEMIQVKASGVSIEGFTLDADNTALAASTTVTVSGATADASEAITAYYAGVNNLVVRNNVVQNFDYFGVTIYPYYASGAIPAAQPNSGHVIADNLFRNFGTYAGESAFWGGAVLLYNNAYAQVTGNTMSNVRIGVQTGNFHLASPDAGFAHAISGNTITARRRGVFNNLFYSAATGFPVASNTITGVMNASETVFDGILVSSYSVPVAHTGNTVSAGDVTNPSDGIEVWNSAASAPGVTIAGGSVAGFTRGLFLNNYEGYNTDSSTGAIATASGMSISGCTTGIEVRDSALSTLHGPVSLAFGAGMTVSGGTTGLLVTNAAASVSSVGDAAFSGQSGNYIALAGNASAIDATGATFGGATGATATLAANYDIEDKISHKLDDSSLGLVRVKASNVFVSSIGNIGRGVTAASTGDTVNVEAGSYTENITLDKRVALVGAGSGADGTVLSSSTTATPVVSVTGSGLDAANQLVIKDVRVFGAANASGSDGIAIYGDTPTAFVKVDGVHVTGHGQGVHYRSGTISNVSVLNSTFNANNFGVRVATAVTSMDGMTIDGCTMTEQTSSAITTNPSGSQTVVNTNFTVSNSTFANNSRAGVANQHDLSFFGFRGNATLSNVTVTSGNGTAANSNSYGIVFTNGSGRAALGTVSLSNVTVQGHVGKGALTFQLYNETSGVSLSGVSLQNCVAPWGHLILDSTDADAFAVGNTGLKTLNMWNSCGANATGAVFHSSTSGTVLDRTVLADAFQIADQVADAVDLTGLGYVNFRTGHVYVTPASFDARFNTAQGALQRAIAAASAGDVIHVKNGTETYLTAEITKSVTFDGAFTVNAASLPDSASATTILSSFMSRLATGSTASANLLGMTANQIAAVNANLAGFTAFSNNPVAVVRGGADVAYYTTIQTGINGASAGDTVRVAAGTYAESLDVTKSLTLVGANAGVNPNTGTRGAETVIQSALASSDPANRAFQVRSGNQTVVIDGFKIVGGNPLHDGNETNFARTSDVTFTNNIAENCNSIFSGSTTSWDEVVVSNNRFTTSNATALTSAMQLQTPRVATVTGNVITNAAYAGILLDGVDSATVTGNSIDGTTVQGIQLAGAMGTSTIDGNTIANANTSLGADRGAIRLYGSAFTGATTVSNNTISSSHNGLAIRNSENWTGKTLNLSGNTITVGTGSSVYHGGTGELNFTGANSVNGIAVSGASLSDLYTVSGTISDGMDVSGKGLVRIKSANAYVVSTGSVALGVAAASANDTLNVAAGNFSDGAITLNKVLTVNGAAPASGVLGYSFTLGTADSVVLAGDAGIDVTGNANGNAITANGGANVLAGAAGVDAATMGIAMPSSLAVSGGSIAVGADTVSGIERLVFTDGTVAVIGVTGSEYTSLNQVLALAGGEKLFGTLAINSLTFATAAELNAITARFVGGSTVSVDVLGMNATQLAAVAGNATASGVVVYPPVQVVSGTSITGYFATIQAGIDFASAGDVVNVAAGTYAVSNAVTVSKAISLRGAQYGVDARTRTGSESVINASGTSGASGAGVIVSAGVVGATIDGFTVTGAANGLAGIYLAQTSAGTTVSNNIVTGNNTGIMPNSGSATTQTVVERNRFSDNLAVGSTSSPAVYIDDSTVGGSVAGLVIRNNLFTNTTARNSFAIVIDNEGTTHLTGVTISGNEFTANSLGMMLVGLADSTVSGNAFNSDYAIDIYDGLAADVPANANLTISGNTFTSPTSAVRISDFGFGAYSGTLALSGNTFTGCTNAIINGGAPAVVSAVGATFDGVLLDGTTALGGIYTIAGKVLDSVDNGGYGDVVLRAGNVYVTSTNSVASGIATAAAGDTVNIQAGTYLDGPVTVNTANLTVSAEAGVSGFSFTLGTANSLVLAGAGDVNVLGNAAANSVTASAGANSINGAAGVDTAVFASAAPSSLVAGSTISVGADSVTNVEKLVFSDATIALVGTGGSEYATLNAALAATTTEKLFGTLAINSSTFATAAELNAITARFVSGSTVSVDVLGMNATQLAAVAGNATASGVVVYPPMQVVRGGTISGYFPTIAAAMTFAADGDTVNIAAGTYTEQFAITKDITVQGPNSAVAGNGTRVAEAILDYSAASPADGQFVLVAKGALKGVTIRDNLLPVGGESSPRIAVRVATGASAAVSNNVFFRDSGLNAPTGHPQRNVDFRAMHVDQTAGGSATISGNYLTGATAGLFSNQGWFRGVWTQGVASAVAVTNNVFAAVRSPMNIQDDMSMLTVDGNAFNGVGVTVLSFGNSGIAGFTDASTVSGSFTLGANAFNNSGTLFNLTAVPAGFTLDATASTFNGTAFSAMDLAGHMEIAARSVQSITNAAKNGLVRSKAGNVYVPGVIPAALAGGIGRAITVASVGDTVNVSAGTFVGNINIGKRLALVGAGAATVVSSNTASTPAITVSASGSSATDRLVVSNLTATGATGGSNSGAGIYVSGSGAISNLTFDGVTVTGNTGFGIAFNNTFATSDVKILNSTVSSNTDVGIRIASATPSFTDLLVDGCTVSSNGTFGFASNPSQTNTVVNTRFTIQNSTFSGNNTAGGGNNHVMFFGAFQGDATISNVDITADQRAHGIVFNGWGNTTVAQWPAAGTIVMNDVVFNGTIDKTCTYFYRYSTLAGVTMTDCDMSAVTTLPTWHQLSADTLGTLNAGNTKLRSISSGGCAIDATACAFYDSVGAVDKSVLANLYRIEDAIRHQVDTGVTGLVRVNAASVYLSKNSGTLENAIAASSAGDVVYVENGTAWTLVNEITKSITFSGSFTVTAANIPTGATANAVLASFVTRGAPGATFSAVTTGMSADQLNAVGNSYASFNGGVTGDLTLTSAQSAAQISAILAGAGNGSAYVVATGMGDDQLNAVAAAATKVATDGITGTMIVTSAIADGNLGALLGKAALAAATVEINASGMTDGELSTVVLAGDRVDEAYNLALDNGQSDVEITALLGKSVASASTGKLMATADATSMVAAKLNALGGSYAKLGANGITGSVALNSGVTDANLTNLFTKIALAATVRVDGTGLGASTLTIVSANIAKVDSAFALFVTNAQSTTELGNVLGVSDLASATANATGMDSTAGGKLATLANNYTKFTASGISGSFTITSGLTPTQIANLLSKVDFGTGGSSFLPPASITIDATGMSGAQLSTIATSVASAGSSANQAAVFDIVNLSLTDGQTAGEIAILLNSTLANEATVDATGMDASQLAALGNAPAAVDQITGTVTITADLTAAQIAAIMGNTATTAQVTIDSTGMSPEQQAAVLSTAVMVVSAEATVATGNLFTVDVDLSGLSTAAVGVQARIGYDASRIEFVADANGDGDADGVGGTDMPTTIFVNAGTGTVSFGTGVDLGGDGTGFTTANAARLTFRALVPFCGATDLVWLIASDATFTNRATTSAAVSIPFTGTNFSNVTSLNNLQLAGVPSSDTTVAADAGTTAGAAISEPTVTASNNCVPSVSVVRTITFPNATTSSIWPARFPVGASTVTWTATDAGGNVASATRTYTVANYQLATIDVNLIGGINPAITFNQVVRIRLSSGDIVTATVPFTGNNGAVVDAQIPVRSDYTCITVKDAAHTVADAQTLSVSGTKYVASGSFQLISGDSNDDNVVDILDFGAFVSDRGIGKTPASRSNFDRNAVVNNADFSFISLNFLVAGDTCGGGSFDGDAPRTRVSVKDLRRAGLGHLEEADINMDGWLDQTDMALAMQGQYRKDFADRLDAADEVPMTDW